MYGRSNAAPHVRTIRFESHRALAARTTINPFVHLLKRLSS
jgi:hypothetical protein